MSSGPILHWINQYPAANTNLIEQRSQITTDFDGNAYVCYTTQGDVSGGTHDGANTNEDIVVMKVDKSGSIVWIKQNTAFNTPGTDTYPSIAVDSSKNVYVAYATNGEISTGAHIGVVGSYNIVVFKLNSTGDFQWIKQNYDTGVTTPADDNIPITLAVDKQGNPHISFFITSQIPGGSYEGLQDVAVSKLDTNTGDIIWQKQYAQMNTVENEFSPSIGFDAAGNIYVAYISNGIISGGSTSENNTLNVVVAKLSASGEFIWAKESTEFNSNGNYSSQPSLAVDDADNSYVTYYTCGGTVPDGTQTGGCDIVVFKLNTAGDTVWTKQLGEMNNDSITYPDGLRAISLDYLGNVYVAYKTFGTIPEGDPDNNIVISKLDNNGNLLWAYQKQDINALNGASSYFASVAVSRYGDIYCSYYTSGNVEGGINQGNNDIIVLKMRQNNTNSFAARVNPYLARDTVLVYTKETVDALIARTTLPAQTTVSWAPIGVPAGSLLRDLGSTAVVATTRRNPLHAYQFQRVQLIGGAGSEGVSGSLADQDAYKTGYICTWSASGIAPVF